MSQKYPPVAIIGISSLFPGARNMSQFWRNILDGHDAIKALSDSEWQRRFHQQWEDGPLALHCRRGGYIDSQIEFDPLSFGVMPAEAEGAEPDQLLTLQLVDEALHDAGYAENYQPPRHTAVMIGRGSYIGPGMSNAAHYVRAVEEILASVQTLIPDLDRNQVAELKQAYRKKLKPYGPVNAIGLVPNLAASRVANRFNFDGAAFTVDAACSSTLIALDSAVRELQQERSSLAIAGGIHLANDLGFMSIFHALGAVSREQQIKPFHRDADGLLIGEGIGMFVLKRLDDAIRDEDRIYAIVRGIGTSSDGSGSSMMQPRSDGQLKALERAWAGTDLDPSRLGLIEAHGTGTPTGDATELETLRRFFRGRFQQPPGIGSVKSMIGHAMPAAGAAGLAKAALALHHKTLPPTLHCDEPHSLVPEGGLRPISTAEPWESEGSRVAALNAFGFGGINAHVILEEHEQTADATAAFTSASRKDFPAFAFYAAANTQDLDQRLERNQTGGSGPARIAIQDPTSERVALARKILSLGKRWRGRRGIWFSDTAHGDDDGKVVFMFPGLEGRVPVDVNNLERLLGPASDPSHSTIPQKDVRLTESVSHYRTARRLSRWLEDVGIHPDAMVGHSIGEWTGMVMAGISDPDEAEGLIASLDDRSFETPDVVYGAAGCDSATALAAADGFDDVVLSHDNCPHQVILCGPDADIREVLSRLRGKGVICEELTFRSGHHTPYFRPAAEMHARELDASRLRPARTPLWSATTVTPYPDNSAEISDLFIAHLTEPVRFRELIEKLHQEGCRTFIQLGVGRLQSFVSDTLKDCEHTAVSCLESGRTDSEQFARCMAELWCEGHPVELSYLGDSTVIKKMPSKPMIIDVTDPLVPMDLSGLRDRLGTGTSLVNETSTGAHPVLQEVERLQSAISASANDIAKAWRTDSAGRSATVAMKAPVAPPAAETQEFKVRFDMESFPEVVDHCLCEQPEDWPHMEDRFPVMPMTASVTLIMEYAERACPGKVAVEVRRIRALRWIVMAPATETLVTLKPTGPDRYLVAIGEFISAEVQLADDYPPNPPAPRPFEVETDGTPPMSGKDYYSERWAFHGPAYQGVADIPTHGANGLESTLRVPTGKGALLDNVGQMIGYWGLSHAETNKTFFPMRVRSIRLYDKIPEIGEQLTCRVWAKELSETTLSADAQVVYRDRTLIDIEGWHDHRFESGLAMWRVFQWPETHAFAEKTEDGYCIAPETWRTAASRLIFARRYLNQRELDEFLAKTPLAQREWLLGRIAAKDAARIYLWEQGAGPLFPIEISIRYSESGTPVAFCPGGVQLNLSIAHKPSIAVAMVDANSPVGVDVEKIEARGPEFESTAFTESERALLPSNRRDEWATRFWAAKEAAGKAAGKGLQTNPRKVIVDTVDGERIRVNGEWVGTQKRENYVLGWTVLDNTAGDTIDG